MSNNTSLAENRKARFDYEILETYEAGMELLGTEVKAIKTGRGNLTGCFAVIRNNEAFLLNANIPAYQPANAPKNYDPQRTRRLLLKKAEIRELLGKTAQKGLTLIPLKMYNKNGKIKVLLGLGRNKKKSDKRETIKKRDVEREVKRTLSRE